MANQPPLFVGSKVDAQDGKKDALVNSFQQIERWSETLTAGGTYASLTGPGQTTTPGDLAQAGGLSVTAPVGDTVGFKVTDNSNTGIDLDAVGNGGISLLDSGSGNISIACNGSAGAINIQNFTTTGGIQINNAGSGGILIEITNVAGQIQLFTNGAGVVIGTFGDKVGFYNATAVAQHAGISAPSGGTTVDTQARNAIVSILNVLAASSGGVGLTA